ncbi:MAG: HlyD family efflux transporter periplasmic adaptor subunit [Candidatus Faecousia sp.]|nr:HlyD family efflux transporter periplasmic adaptor subunit [Candidatus Faecousia sp.]
MKQGDLYLKILVIALSMMVAVYFLFSILKSPDSTYETYTAVLYEVGDGISTSGFVVRDEKVLTSTEKIVALTRSEGERVGKGQVVANCYSDAQAQERQSQIDALEEELEQMEYAYSFSSANAESASLDADIVRLMNEVSVYVNRGELDFASGSAEELKSYVLRRYVTDDSANALWKRITETKDKLSDLYARSGQKQTITVDEAGYFSGTVDGYETVLTPEFVQTATVSQVEGLEQAAQSQQGDEIGKLVRDARWYYMTVVDTESIQSCSKGDIYPVHFAYDFYDDVNMRVARIGEDEDGKCVVVLTTDDYMQDAITLRQQSADIVFGYKSGLRVPKEAIHVDEDGVSGVYVLQGAEAEWKPVQIIYDNGESYIVKLDKSSTDNLWPDDEIILTDYEIYDGKVMGQ